MSSLGLMPVRQGSHDWLQCWERHLFTRPDQNRRRRGNLAEKKLIEMLWRLLYHLLWQNWGGCEGGAFGGGPIRWHTTRSLTRWALSMLVVWMGTEKGSVLGLPGGSSLRIGPYWGWSLTRLPQVHFCVQGACGGWCLMLSITGSEIDITQLQIASNTTAHKHLAYRNEFDVALSMTNLNKDRFWGCSHLKAPARSLWPSSKLIWSRTS